MPASRPQVEHFRSSPSDIRYLRDPHESIAAFRARPLADAERTGEKIIIFNENEAGDLSSDCDPDEANLISITDAPRD
jgi:hypothetical protein